jgi:hypothetical protein
VGIASEIVCGRASDYGRSFLLPEKAIGKFAVILGGLSVNSRSVFRRVKHNM